jgi:uncharacterized protein (TIGR02246 family)
MDCDIEAVASDMAERLQSAWNHGDAQAFAGLFADGADFIHILGGHGRGRTAVAAAHEALFSGIYRGSKVRFDLVGVRPLGEDAFIALLSQHLEYGAGGDVSSMACRPSLIVQRQAEWRIVLLQNTRTAELAPKDLADHPFARKRSTELTS